MTNKKVFYLLALTLVILTLAPLVGSTFFLDRTLETTLNLGFNSDVVKILNDSSDSLKRLKDLDPKRAETYKSQFEKIQELRTVYNDSGLVKGQIEGALKIYFWAGLLISMGFALFVALYLSSKINQSYQVVFNNLVKEKERVIYLEEISSWQELAKMLAHEIKNPLTPIEVLVSSLTRSYISKDNGEFQSHLEKTQAMINEELGHIKAIVNRFSEFSKLPKVEMRPSNLMEVLLSIIGHMKVQYPEVRVQVVSEVDNIQVALDKTLFRQVIFNIINNGIEANPGKAPHFSVSLIRDLSHKTVALQVSNDGTPIPQPIAQRIFEPYVSSKKDKTNMGLGLTIAKKIVVEHGGTIDYQEIASRPSFIITLPEVK